MRKIAVLDQNTIDKIAAGEVVERPASVVKELVENAVDAGATAVTVEIKEGGISFIRVTDNGNGIEKEQVPLAFLRHATSKIEKVEDLAQIASLGFRGEALSSISAVSQMEVITKTGDALTGVRYVIEGGQEKVLEEVGAPNGTTMLVRNLFYNTPARGKFLKTPMTEAGYVSAYMEQLALSHQDISFKYMVNGQTRLHTSGNSNLKDVIYGIYGRDITRELLEVHFESSGIAIDGFIGKPVVSRGNRNFENYYINGRYVKSKILMKAIEEAYKPYMMQHKYPFVCLQYTIDGNEIDVNVHPTKMEVRFQNQGAVYNATYDMITQKLAHRELIPDVTLEKRTEKKQKEQREKLSAPEPFEERYRQRAGQQPSQIREGSAYAALAAQKPAAKQEAERKASCPNPADSVTGTAASVSGTLPSGSLQPEASGSVGVKPWGSKPFASPDAVSQHGQTVQPFPAEQQTQPLQVGQPILPAQPEQALQSFQQTQAMQPSQSEQSIPSAPPELLVQTAQPGLEASEDRSVCSQASSENTVPSDSIAGKAEQLELFDGRLLSKEARSRHRIIGQLFDTYWLVEYDGKFYIIDQHAAHEKVLYERFMKEFENRQVLSQMIAPPEVISLNLQEDLLLKTHLEVFERFGFEISEFGGREYTIHAVPANVYGISIQELFVEILDSLENENARRPLDLITSRIATAACKAAVKGNNALSEKEADKLIDELLGLEDPYHCPHGRPTIVSMTKYELEKKFKRIV